MDLSDLDIERGDLEGQRVEIRLKCPGRGGGEGKARRSEVAC